MKGHILRGQTSFDFLVTYGWVMFIVFIVVGVMFALGIFNVGLFIGPRSTGFNQVNVVAWNVDSTGYLKLKLQNYAGMNIQITDIESLSGSNGISYPISNVSISNGMISGVISVGRFGVLTSGSYYTLPLRITYTDSTGFAYSESGTLTGTRS